MLQNPCLASSFEKTFVPLKLWEISSRVGALQFSMMMTLFRSWRSKHRLRVPLGLWGYVGKRPILWAQ